MKLYISVILLILLSSALFAQAPVVENVRFEQRTDGSLFVDIYYDVLSDSNELVQIMIEASDDDGVTWTLPCSCLDGDVGRVTPGRNKHVQWNFYADNPDTCGYGYRVRVTAEGLCHFYVTEDRTLDADLVCDPNTYFAIIIGAPNVTLDLGGHKISRQEPGVYGSGIAVENSPGMTLRNGTLEGFLSAVNMGNSDNSTIENLTIRNLTSTSPDSQITGMSLDGNGIVVRNVKIEFPPIMHHEAINLANCEITIDNLEIIGCSVGIQFGGTVSIINSKFTDVAVSGIIVASTGSAQISGNEFVRNECGIGAYVHGYKPFGITGVNIDGNTFQDCVVGIVFWGTRESSITNNIIRSGGWGQGIQLREHMFNDPINEPDSCFYSTQNVVADNVVLGHVLDVSHHELAVGNTWTGNIFWTKEGDEIPDCNTDIRKTAQGALFSADSAAAELAADAQLLIATSNRCDTTGNSFQWEYTYQSESQQQYLRFRYKDGQIIYQDTLSGDNIPPEVFQPLPASWIDSDSAMVIADSLGGKEFREEFELQTINMYLSNTYFFTWSIQYVAKDTTFDVNFDASKE